MRTFLCHCGNRLYFENTVCYGCGLDVGYLPDRQELAALRQVDGRLWEAESHEGRAGRYRKCVNYEVQQVCNWMVPALENEPFCHACRLNRVIPDLSVPDNRQRWFHVEQAKRRLVYTLDALALPVFGKSVDSIKGLAFEFLHGPVGGSDEFLSEMDSQTSVVTGHGSGVITINIEEADPEALERMRAQMGEAYRTLLGHFRHESGHYYWDLLVRDTPWADRFRRLFGDERADYEGALSAYYRDGPVAGWPASHISAYAASHPWEDWAESWAHYLHMADSLETARDMELSVRGRRVDDMAAGDRPQLDSALKYWGELATALNALNRSMGLADAYPFAISSTVADKLQLIGEVIASARRAAQCPPPNRSEEVPTGPS